LLALLFAQGVFAGEKTAEGHSAVTGPSDVRELEAYMMTSAAATKAVGCIILAARSSKREFLITSGEQT
jgi:hypothetical protein